MSLLEILIAMIIGVFLLTGVYTTYLANRKTFLFEEGWANLQENIRMTITKLNHDIRMMGYVGCARIQSVRHITSSDAVFSETTVLAGWHNNQSTSVMVLPLLIKQRSDSDVLLIQMMDPNATEVLQLNSNQIQVEGKTAFKTDETIVLSDYNHANLLKISKIIYHKPFSFLTVTSPISAGDYLKGAQIGCLISSYYYVAPTSRKNRQGNPVFALYVQENNSTKPAELVEGVEKMRLRFGILSNDQSQLNYFSAEQVTDWTKIKSISINLLFDSIEGVTDKARSYDFDGQHYSATDTRLRKEVNILIALRERLP